ncbi:transposase [Fodinibius sp.]|uniref:transposase n=1 Tax=Fodinibius sp. TaxID=1872440 RepID=UPI002ACED3C8|nr:transposase [Fodinibius sp.]MDZ7659607.1 transposase [Fodinibius sp.]
MRDYHCYFEPNCFYHVYNRAIGSDNLFKEDKNYNFFLGKWDKYVIDYVEIWAYCLMPNHFHFLIKVKDNTHFKDGQEINKFLEGQFKRLLSSYTLSFNKVYDRTGSLFQKSFKRVKINSQNYLLTLIHYIHHNPIHHNFANDYKDWTYSSYNSIVSNASTKVERKNVLEVFGSINKFVKAHKSIKNYNKINHLLVE